MPNTVLSRRSMLKLSAGAAVASQTVPRFAIASPRPQNARPNILFIMTDQQRGDCLGADGNTAIRTPNLDRIAAEGARFSCAYSSTPSCTPARAGLLTGMSPWGHGMLGYSKVADKYPVEMPQLLRDAGYHTLGIGKMHWTPQRNLHGFHKTILDEAGQEQTVDFRSDYHSWLNSVAPNVDPNQTGLSWNDFRSASYVLPEEFHPTRWTGNVACNFLDSYNRLDPFFMKISFHRPHSPYDPPQRFMDSYQDAELPSAKIGKWAERYREQSKGWPDIWHGDMGEEQVRRSRQGYYGSISFVDEQIGRILESLERRGWLEETLVLFTSDHGDMTGDHHLWRKSYAYESSARIPMLLRWPDALGGPRGQVIDNPVELRDILPTFLEAAGAPVPELVEGASMLPLTRGQKEGWRPWLDLEHDICYDSINHWSALCDGKMKYIYHAIDGEEQLFDLQQDPGELEDLAGEVQHSATLQEWRSRLVAHLEPRGEQWVKSGRLVPRPESILRGDNYPFKNA